MEWTKLTLDWIILTIIAHPAISPKLEVSPSSARDCGLISTHVTGSRYIFPNLAPVKGSAWILALAGREECAADYSVSRDKYPFHVVEYVAQGRGFLRFGREDEKPIGPGSVYSYAPKMRVAMRTEPKQPLVKFFFALAGRDVVKHLRDARLPPGAVRRFRAPSEVLTIAEDIIHEGQRHGSLAPAICLKLIELLLLKVADATGEAQARDQRARENFLRCKALIEARASELNSLAEIARAVQLDSASICRFFRRFQGVSPYQYLLRRKMALAAEHLVETGGLVKDAAELVGFDDPYHFARCFKNVHGVTPSEVRRYRLGIRNLGTDCSFRKPKKSI